MKATLEFNLADPDDDLQHTRVLKANELSSVLLELSEMYRNWDKYGLPADREFTPAMVRKEFHEILREHSIDLDTL